MSTDQPQRRLECFEVAAEASGLRLHTGARREWAGGGDLLLSSEYRDIKYPRTKHSRLPRLLLLPLCRCSSRCLQL